jgi:hypothetical protein
MSITCPGCPAAQCCPHGGSACTCGAPGACSGPVCP